MPGPTSAIVLAGATPKDILARYLSNETTTQIAKDYGVTPQALGQFLLKHDEQGWKDAQVARAIARKEEAEDAFDRIRDLIAEADKEGRERLTLSLACARDSLKAAQWDLERVCRRIYGDSVQGPVSAEGLADLLMAVSERMLKEKQIAAIPHAAQQSSGQDEKEA